MQRYKYLLSASTAYFVWGFFSFALRPISNHSALDILSFRLFLCAFVLIAMSFLFRKDKLKQDYLLLKAMTPQLRKKSIGFVVLGAVVLMLNWLSFIYVMNEINVQTAGLSYLICPILATLLGYFILKEKLSKEKWIAIGLATIACSLMAIGHFRELYFSILVALAFAVYLLIQRKLNHFDSFNLLTAQTIVIALILTPLFFVFKGATPTSPVFYGYIVLIVGMFTILPMFLNNFALKGINASTAGILIFINPIVNFLLAIFYYKEPISSIQYMAYGIIFVAIIVFNSGYLFGKKKKKEIETVAM